MTKVWFISMHTWTLIRQRRQCSIVVSFNFASGRLEPFLKWHVIENGMNFRTTVHITDRVSLFDVCPITNIMYSSWNWDQQQHLSDIFPLQSSSSSIFELILDDAKNGRILGPTKQVITTTISSSQMSVNY